MEEAQEICTYLSQGHQLYTPPITNKEAGSLPSELAFLIWPFTCKEMKKHWEIIVRCLSDTLRSVSSSHSYQFKSFMHKCCSSRLHFGKSLKTVFNFLSEKKKLKIKIKVRKTDNHKPAHELSHSFVYCGIAWTGEDTRQAAQ